MFFQSYISEDATNREKIRVEVSCSIFISSVKTFTPGYALHRKKKNILSTGFLSKYSCFAKENQLSHFKKNLQRQ